MMRIFFVSFMLVIITFSHGLASDADKSYLNAAHILSDCEFERTTSTDGRVSSEINDVDDRMLGNQGIGHSSSSCSMDFRVYSPSTPHSQSRVESISWYYAGSYTSQPNIVHLLRPPII